MQGQASKSLRNLKAVEKSLNALKIKRQKLLTKKANLHAEDIYGEQLYDKKFVHLDAEIAQCQSKKEDAFRSEFFYPEQVPLYAAEYGIVKVLQDFVATMTPITSSYIEFKDPTTGNTPILVACSKGYVECAKILIAVGAHVGVVNSLGYTALHCACAGGHPDIVKLLLAVPYFDPYIRERRNLMALHVARIACLENDHWACYEECARLLEDRCGIYRGWLYESVDTSVVKMALNLHSWKQRFVVVLRTSVHSTSLEMSFFDSRQGARLPPVPHSTVVYKLGTPMVQPGTQRSFGNKEYSFNFAGIQRSQEDHRGVMRRIECAALDANGFESWSSFFAKYSVLKDEPDAKLVPLSAPSSSPTLPPFQDTPSISRSSSLLIPPWRTSRSESNPIPLANEEESPPESTGVKQLYDLSQTDLLDMAPSAPNFSPAMAMAALDLDNSVAASAPPEEDLVTQRRECIICFDGPQSSVCVPCGHNAVCMKCADHIMTGLDEEKHCPVCRASIREMIRLYQC
ncbi:hypothetical protein THRCLA_00613 [Thraustotheca clavata]|uniref:RING-type domain-containing protein n=1 Tax=Thraustotheca clavata TaxID=74557 RepID=A0A1W0AAM7_9STRA|nr:hypothetical protein THRCLA_00613 [Thraustotheca clavata]